MSFPGTVQYTKPTEGAKFVVPMRTGKHYAPEYYLTPELKNEFARLFPIKTNHEIMILFGLSAATMHRFARVLGLTKNMRIIRRKQAKMTKKICEENGWYDSLRGRKPSEATLEGGRKWREENGCPILVCAKKNPRRYRKLMKARSIARKELIRKERWRVSMGLGQKTNLPAKLVCDFKHYTKSQTSHRYNALKRGYMLGDSSPMSGERYVIFFDAETERSEKFEQNLIADGFQLEEIIEEVVTEPYKRCID